jgi:hypothetical protein
MRKIIERFVEYPVYANIIIAIAVLAGSLQFDQHEEGLFPGNGKPLYHGFCVLSGSFSRGNGRRGDLPRIEEAVRGLIGIKEINSTSVENSGLR